MSLDRDWDSIRPNRNYSAANAGMGILRITLLFGSAAVALALIATPFLDSRTRLQSARADFCWRPRYDEHRVDRPPGYLYAAQKRAAAAAQFGLRDTRQWQAQRRLLTWFKAVVSSPVKSVPLTFLNRSALGFRQAGSTAMKISLHRFLEDETGATAVEYGLIVAVLSLTVIGGVGQAANAITWLFSDNNSKLVNAFAQ